MFFGDLLIRAYIILCLYIMYVWFSKIHPEYTIQRPTVSELINHPMSVVVAVYLLQTQ